MKSKFKKYLPIATYLVAIVCFFFFEANRTGSYLKAFNHSIIAICALTGGALLLLSLILLYQLILWQIQRKQK